jgi:glycosyltransferase involved in cell wall biosynthesis/Flp pilus assembly protein TadD
MKSKSTHLIFHKDHPLSARGVNSGAENATLWLARTLASRGDQVFIAGHITEGDCTDQNVEFWDIGDTYNIETAFARIKDVATPYHLTSACRALPLVIAKNDPDCLSRNFIAHDPSGTATGVNAKVLSNVCDNIICVSHAQKKLFIDAGVDTQKITVIPNGADLSLFKAGSVNSRKLDRFVFVGALVAHKGIDILLQSFANITASYPNAELHVYGSAALWGQEPFFDQDKIAKQCSSIKFFGAVSQQEISKAFQEAGACIIPSRWFDSFPLTAVEALVTGCPVIAFNVGGISEAVTHEKTGLLIPNPDEAALTYTLEQVLRNPERLKEFSQNALHSSRNVFSWDSFVEKFNECTNRSLMKRGVTTGKVGFITTWNQECGLATYAQFLTGALPEGSFHIFGEFADAYTDEDQEFVSRCWHRTSDDYTNLREAVFSSGVQILHLNCHARFFKYPAFNQFIDECHARSIKVVVSIHTIFTTDEKTQALFSAVDKIFVHCDENIPEALSNGATLEKIEVIPHGIQVREQVSYEVKEKVRKEFNIKEDEKLLVCFGFVQPHKGLDALLETVTELRRKGDKVVGAICGIPNSLDTQAQDFYLLLKQIVKDLHIEEYIRFTDRFLSEQEVTEILGTADIVLMNYRSHHYEASGACSVAVGCGAAVVTSIFPPFQAFKDAVFHATTGYPVMKAVEVLLEQPNLLEELRARARSYAKQFSWKNTVNVIQRKYRTLGLQIEGTRKDLKENNMASSDQQTKLKVLLCNRPSTFTQRGGDTVVIEKLMAEISKYPVDITLNLEGTISPVGFDIVHIFNFALPDMVEYYARQAKQAGVPYVVTTLLEDVPNFHFQSHFVASALQEYQRVGQNKVWWNQNRPDYRSVEKAPAFQNTYAAQHATALYPNGATEAHTLQKTYGVSSNIKEIKLGYELGLEGDAERFFKKYGVKHFALCVGRIESRKNQLMLLKALEDEDITVVLAGGGFTYQPEYAKSVEQFKRKGKTVILSKLSDQDLADAYAAAKVHVLPSWYELPGLVSLEAAYYGCNIVATRQGTAYDYLGEFAFYCDPGDEDSIRSAVIAAYYAPVNPNLKEKVMTYSWKEMAEKTFASYKEASGWKQPVTASVQTQTPTVQAVPVEQPVVTTTVTATGMGSADPVKYQELLEKGELLAREHKFESAIEAFDEAEHYSNGDGQLYRAKGATLLAAQRTADAKTYFQKAVLANPTDAKAFCGLGMSQGILGDTEASYDSLVKSLCLKPDHAVAILQLMHVAYALNRFSDLENALRLYTQEHKDDLEMQFCLAGCLYKLDKMEEALAINDMVLKKDPGHRGAFELSAILQQSKTSSPSLTKKVEVERATQSRSDLSSIDGTFTEVDQEIIMIEECKRKGKYSEAFSRIAALSTNQSLSEIQKETIICQKAESLVLTDQYKQAEENYNVVLSKNPDSSRALCGQGALAAAKGNWIDAEKLFSEALMKRPEYDVALSGLGLSAAQRKQSNEAWSFYRRALKSNPENVRALLGTIEMGYALQRLPEVEEVISEYLELHPADIDFMYSLAGCYFAQGKVAEAAEAINTITLFEPQHQNALELRAMIEKQGESITA